MQPLHGCLCPASSAKFRNEWSCTTIPPYACTATLPYAFKVCTRTTTDKLHIFDVVSQELLLKKSVFVPKAVHVGFVVGRLALGQVCL